jgi:hypothetical protein
MKAAVEVITPALAQEWLNTFNTKNRTISEKTVETYARDMKAGAWAVNSQGIGFDDDGTLLDGQQRLAAIIKACVPVKMLVVRGLPKVYLKNGDGPLFTQDTIDKNRVRSNADVLNLTHNLTDTNFKSAIVTSIVMGLRGTGPTKMSSRIVYKVYSMYDEEIETITSGLGTKSRLKYAPPIAGMALAAKVNMEKAVTFKDQYINGTNLPEGCPALTLRNYMLSRFGNYTGSHSSRMTNLNLSLTALKYSFDGKKLKVLKNSDYAREYFVSRQANFVQMVKELLAI